MTTAAAKSQNDSALDLSALLRSMPGMPQVDSLIRSKFTSEVPLLTEIPAYLLDLGGKRIRPLLTLLSAALNGMPIPSQAVIDVAAGIELIHMATLLHDDIIDRSPLRRHEPSPLVRFGMPSTLLSGDFLLTRAFSLCARLDSFVIDATELACIALTEGEISETPLHQFQHTVASSTEIARKKTASLFRLACETGAHLAGADSKAVMLMAEFGESLGIAFQMLDDLLDVTSSEDLLGKRTGIDIRERKPSIVNVIWLQSRTSLAQGLTRQPPESTEGDIEDARYVSAALEELRDSPVIEEVRRLALGYSNRASTALEQLCQANPIAKATPAYSALQAVIAITTSRLS